MSGSKKKSRQPVCEEMRENMFVNVMRKSEKSGNVC